MAYSRPLFVDRQLAGGQTADDPHIVVGTGVNAVQAEGAIHIAYLPRLKESQFTSSLNHFQVRRLLPPSTNTILRPAIRAYVQIPNFYFQRGYGRSDKVELPDRANELAECGMFEYSIDNQD